MTGRQQRALAALIRAPTLAAAAADAGVGVSTLRRWMRENPKFQAAYRQAMDELLQDATRQAQQSMRTALSTLREIAENADEQAAPRVSAADKLLTHAAKLTEQNDILSRLDALEAQAEPDGS